MHRAPPSNALELAEPPRLAVLPVERTTARPERRRIGVVGAGVQPSRLAGRRGPAGSWASSGTARGPRPAPTERTVAIRPPRSSRGGSSIATVASDPAIPTGHRHDGPHPPVDRHGRGARSRSPGPPSPPRSTGPARGGNSTVDRSPRRPGEITNPEVDHSRASGRNSAAAVRMPRELDAIGRELHPGDDAVGQHRRLALLAADQRHVADAATARASPRGRPGPSGRSTRCRRRSHAPRCSRSASTGSAGPSNCGGRPSARRPAAATTSTIGRRSRTSASRRADHSRPRIVASAISGPSPRMADALPLAVSMVATFSVRVGFARRRSGRTIRVGRPSRPGIPRIFGLR